MVFIIQQMKDLLHGTGFAKKVFELSNIDIKVNPVGSDMYPTPTKRPANSKLSKEKLKSIGIIPINYEEALKEYLKGEI